MQQFVVDLQGDGNLNQRQKGDFPGLFKALEGTQADAGRFAQALLGDSAAAADRPDASGQKPADFNGSFSLKIKYLHVLYFIPFSIKNQPLANILSINVDGKAVRKNRSRPVSLHKG